MSKRQIVVTVGDKKLQVPQGTLVGEVAAMVPASQGAVVARVDNDILGYQFPLTADCSIEFLDTKTMDGMRAYRASLVFLFVRAALETIPGCTVHIKHSLNNGFYGEFEHSQPVIEKDIRAIEERMRELVEEDIPFTREICPWKRRGRSMLNRALRIRSASSTSRRATSCALQFWLAPRFSALYFGTQHWLLEVLQTALLPAWVYYQYPRANPTQIPNMWNRASCSTSSSKRTLAG